MSHVEKQKVQRIGCVLLVLKAQACNVSLLAVNFFVYEFSYRSSRIRQNIFKINKPACNIAHNNAAETM